MKHVKHVLCTEIPDPRRVMRSLWKTCSTTSTPIKGDEDEVEEGQPEQCKCHCNCKQEEVITGVEVFLLTSVGIIIISLTVYSCLALRYCILKQRKLNVQLALAESKRVQEENEKQEKEKRLKLIEELKNEAIELGTLQKMPRKQDEY